jgi:hypothetical protein
MNFNADEKTVALATAYEVLVITLVEAGALDAERFGFHSEMGVARLASLGFTDASSALAEMLEPLNARLRQRGGGA